MIKIILKYEFLAEVDATAKKVIANRIHLCQKRIEKLSSLNTTPKMKRVQGKEYKLEEPETESKGIFSQLTDSLKSMVYPQPQEGVIGVMTTDHPDKNGEWLTSVVINNTKTMTNPVDASLNYTVYMMTVTTKIVREGKVIDTPSWVVIRRYYQFKMFNSKVRLFLFFHNNFSNSINLVKKYENIKSS